MKTWEELEKAIEIFKRYSSAPNISATHDMIFMGPRWSAILEEDRQLLESMGWREEFDSPTRRV